MLTGTCEVCNCSLGTLHNPRCIWWYRGFIAVLPEHCGELVEVEAVPGVVTAEALPNTCPADTDYDVVCRVCKGEFVSVEAFQAHLISNVKETDQC